MGAQKFVIVSNRLPVSVRKQDGKLSFSPSSGGLATAMSSLDISTDSVWVGWPGIASDELTATDKKQIIRELKQYGCYPVFLTQQQVAAYYEGYANATIWPVFHYFQSLSQHHPQYWAAYQEVNQLFCDAVEATAHAESTIWVHDYQLMLLPALLRGVLPKSSIGFFMHIPFPSFEIFRLLPNRREILEGLLGADLIGFHTYDYARHFLSSVLRTLGYANSYGTIAVPDRAVRVDSFPIGIDYQKFTRTLHSAVTKRELKTLQHYYGDKRIVLSVDRLDYSKGIPHRLEAFEKFLQQNPQYHKKVVLVVIAVPSRVEVDAYKNLRDVVEQTVSRINGTYAAVDWTPISYQFQNLPFEQLVALYAMADVALVTPLRDGMNLVAKEYVASKQLQPGVLILSEMAGAIDELPEALSILPSDTDSIVQALGTALRMPKAEQRSRLAAMQARLSHYDVQRWAQDFTDQLATTKQSQAARGNRALTPEAKEQLATAFRTARHRTLFLDYDGTLLDFVPSPDHRTAAPPPSLAKLIRHIASLPHTDLAIVSGRTRAALEAWFGDMPVSLVAEHGAWIKQHGEWAQQPISLNGRKQELLPLLQLFTERTPGAYVEEKNFALVWHYRNVSPELAYARSRSLKHELDKMLNGTELRAYHGNKIVEVKPRGITKGGAVDEILADVPSDFILCIGDDYTDEDMFEVVPEEAYTIKVGPGETRARYQLASVRSVVQLLKLLADQ